MGYMMFGLSFMLLGSLCNIMWMAHGVLASVERKATLVAVSSLLDIVCDAVVELDDGGGIVSSAR
eukprot:648904-Heterocapsa_arctica.AAC.1